MDGATRHPGGRLRLSILLGLVVAAISFAGIPEAEAAKKWMDPRQFTAAANRSVKLEHSSATIGRNGYAVLTWAQYPKRFTGYSEKSRLNSRVMARVRLPGAKKFGPARVIGPLGSSVPEVEIGANGYTVLAWLSKSRHTTVATRLPRGGWSKGRVVPGPQSQSTGQVSVGPDGTAALLREGRWITEGVRPPLFASVRAPGGNFGPFERIDSAELGRGYFLAVTAGRDGKATAVFESACPRDVPLEEIRPMQYVDLWRTGRGLVKSAQADIPNSKCPTYYPTLSQDLAGRQYLLVNGSAPFNLLDVKVARRAVGRPFGAAESLLRPKEGTGSRKMTVSSRGRVDVMWRSGFRHLPGSRWVRATSHGMAPFSKPERVLGENIFSLGAANTYPDGTIASVWMTTKYQFGLGLIPKLKPLKRADFPWKPFRIRNVPRFGVEMSVDGRALAWWEFQNDSGEGVDSRWMNFPHRPPPK